MYSQQASKEVTQKQVEHLHLPPPPLRRRRPSEAAWIWNAPPILDTPSLKSHDLYLDRPTAPDPPFVDSPPRKTHSPSPSPAIIDGYLRKDGLTKPGPAPCLHSTPPSRPWPPLVYICYDTTQTTARVVFASHLHPGLVVDRWKPPEPVEEAWRRWVHHQHQEQPSTPSSLPLS